jgi:predicted 2-oxoglutarate/Fe(II)-dependent dioxygenase YbiX
MAAIPTCVKDLVMEIPNFLDEDERAQVIAMANAHGFHEATVNDSVGAQLRPDVRNNERVIFDDHALAARFWEKISVHCQSLRFGARAIALNERFRVYRYKPGNFFDWHQDGVFARDNGEKSRFTLLICLNDEFEGGATSFSAVLSPYVFDDFQIEAQAGKALLFFHPISHRGDVVVSGEKYMLRTDVMYRPKEEEEAAN